MAEAVFVCIYPNCSAPGSSRENSPGRGSSAASSPILASLSIVLGSNVSTRWLYLGESHQEGPPVTGWGHNLSPPARDMEAMSLAPEGDQPRLLRPF